MAQASEFVIIPKNDGGKKSNDGEELGGRGSVNVDVAVIVTKLEEFVKEQVKLTVFILLQPVTGSCHSAQREKS